MRAKIEEEEIRCAVRGPREGRRDLNDVRRCFFYASYKKVICDVKLLLDVAISFHPTLQVIVERYSKERHLPLLNKTKFLVPEELTMSQLVAIVR